MNRHFEKTTQSTNALGRYRYEVNVIEFKVINEVFFLKIKDMRIWVISILVKIEYKIMKMLVILFSSFGFSVKRIIRANR